MNSFLKINSSSGTYGEFYRFSNSAETLFSEYTVHRTKMERIQKMAHKLSLEQLSNIFKTTTSMESGQHLLQFTGHLFADTSTTDI